jgi:hypothetical protein
MGGVRALFGTGFVTLALAIAACSSASTGDASSDADAEAPRVPDPPPRYKPLQATDAAPYEGDGSSELVIRCGRDKPYVCPLDDGTFACSSVPCLPDCTRIGCLGSEVCQSCDGGYRCVDPESGC